MHDERQYPRPDTFDPDRFLEGCRKDGLSIGEEMIDSAPDPRSVVFGFGRRCVVL